MLLRRYVAVEAGTPFDMVEVLRLQPHDPVPENGRYLVVMRRFAEEAPRVTVIELIESDGVNPPVLTVPVGGDGTPLGFEDAVRLAAARAEHDGLDRIYAVDRTAGPREREVLAHGGNHAVHLEQLADTDLEEGEPGSDMRDRPPDAGYNLTPARGRGHRPRASERAEDVLPGSDAPSRAGITGTGSGADKERG
jgi:hypothetical protein